MPSTWFTADTHLGHANIIKFCQRPYLSAAEAEQARENPRGSWHVAPETVERHDAAILAAINSLVGPDDTLWVLGDFCMGKYDAALAYRNRIVCRSVHLVVGNHDHPSVRPVFDSVIDQGLVTIDGHDIWLNHYPMRSWHGSFHGSWQLYGHVHGRLVDEDARSPWLLTRDVGVDACGYQPVSLGELRRYMKPREKAFQERRAEVMRHDEGGKSSYINRGSLA